MFYRETNIEYLTRRRKTKFDPIWFDEQKILHLFQAIYI